MITVSVAKAGIRTSANDDVRVNLSAHVSVGESSLVSVGESIDVGLDLGMGMDAGVNVALSVDISEDFHAIMNVRKHTGMILSAGVIPSVHVEVGTSLGENLSVGTRGSAGLI